MRSIKPRNQRKELYNAPLHKKRKWISAHLEEKLLLKYDKRAVPVVKGDTVRVMRGSFRGHEDKVANVNVGKRNIEIEGITMSKADGNKIARPLHSSNVIIIKLNLTDKWRRKKLERGLSEETKKEIEKEAEEQIKEVEEERIKEEEEKALEEEKEIKEVVEEPEKSGMDIHEEETKPDEKKIEKKPAQKLKSKSEEIKERKTKKTTKPKKSSEKRETTTKKKSMKKTQIKSAKKEDNK